MFLRRFAMPLLARVKETTGIVGLDVVRNAWEVLISLYAKTLKEIKVVLEDKGYRKAVESFTRHRLKVCQEEEDWEVIEKCIGCGQVEELIEEAQDELKLISMMIVKKNRVLVMNTVMEQKKIQRRYRVQEDVITKKYRGLLATWEG